MVSTIGELLRQMEDYDSTGITTYSRFVKGNMRDDIDKTEAYYNSKHISGDTDYLGRPKPFYNISVGATNIWHRATDIDRKNIRFSASAIKNEIGSFFATILLSEWMKKSSFGRFLNEWGYSLAKHGSSVSKFVEKNGELTCKVMDWNDIFCDAVDFDNNPAVEKLWFTPAQLRKQKGYNQEVVKSLLSAVSARETISGEDKDSKENYISLFEVHGELPLSLLTKKEEDEETYTQQVHIVSYVVNDNTGDIDDFTLYSGKESKSPYHITHLIKKEGQTYTGGAVKNQFEAQWMINDSIKLIHDQLELASKVIFQGSDEAMMGKNAGLWDTGVYLVHKPNEPMTRVNNSPDIVGLQSFKNDWQNQGNLINGIAESMISQAKSGTAWRQTQAELAEAHSLFDLMRQNKSLYLEDILRKYVIPFFKKKLNNSDEISSILENHQIKYLEAKYIPNEAIRMVNEKKKKTILSGEIYDPSMEGQDLASAEASIKSGFTGNQQFFKPSTVSSKTWKEALKDLEFDINIDITGESKDAQATIQTLDMALKFIVGLQGRPMSDDERLLFNRILSEAGGVSPIELKLNSQTAPVTPNTAGMAGVGGSKLTQ